MKPYPQYHRLNGLQDQIIILYMLIEVTSTKIFYHNMYISAIFEILIIVKLVILHLNSC